MLLEVKDLVTEFPTRKGIVRAVDGVTFGVDAGGGFLTDVHGRQQFQRSMTRSPLYTDRIE